MRSVRSSTRLPAVAVALVLGCAALAAPVTAAAIRVTPPPYTVAATQPPSPLAPGQSATSTITLTNNTAATIAFASVKVALGVSPVASPVSTATITLAPAPGIACTASTASARVQICVARNVAPHASVTVGTLTGTPPATIGSGVTASAVVAAPWNTVVVTWRWAPVTGAPVNVIPPTIVREGLTTVATTYEATTGTWTGTPPIMYTYQWYLCTGIVIPATVVVGAVTPGSSCSAVAGATGSTYVASSCETGDGLAVVVTATNSLGSAQAASSIVPIGGGPILASTSTSPAVAPVPVYPSPTPTPCPL